MSVSVRAVPGGGCLPSAGHMLASRLLSHQETWSQAWQLTDGERDMRDLQGSNPQSPLKYRH